MRDDKLIEGMRESFEAWFSDDWQHPNAVERDAVGYKLAQAQNAWTVWQAAWQAALAALREQEGWKPWSRAHEAVGQRVLILFERSGHIEDATIYEVDGKLHYVLFDGESLNDSPSHWMPLPEAPQPEEAP